ncbi:putative ABC transporter, AAA+ ATPase domain, ABC-2 type transporter [Helianthus annuus]|nr:putative ABC transporter, AAA+ ATPase domain, ABC-2 type transporter [Helianthus annuus]
MSQNTCHETVIDMVKPTGFTGRLEFENLTYTVVKKKKTDDGKWVSQEVDLLNRISGYSPKGCVTAVMGPSGAGKSTFLDALAGRIASGSLKGKVVFDGAEMSPSLIKRSSAYIMQDDRLFPMLTVYETLMFAADFRLGSIAKAEKKQRVETLIEQLGLISARNTYIGDEGTRGVSGGERRRVSIGVDIIHGPSLLFLDEPTSGLDSTSAQSVIEKVHNIARAGSTVVLTIHQPSSRILLLLDHLIILARGQLMYQGSPKDVGPHLGRMGRKVPKGENAIEFLIDVIQRYDQSEYGVDALAKFVVTGTKPPMLSDDETPVPLTPTPPHHQHDNGFDHSVRSPWSNSKSWTQSVNMKSIISTSPYSSDYTVNEDDYITRSMAADASNHHHLGPKFVNSFFTETWVLMRRNFITIKRTPELFLSRLMVLTIMGFMMATMFKNPERTMQGITNRLSFFIFTVCLFFFSSNDAVPAFIQERFIFVRETSHNAYRASSYTIAGRGVHCSVRLLAVAKLDPNDRGSKTYIPKNFNRTGGSKTYIPKNFYTKTTYITLLSEKFGGSGAPPRPFCTSPLVISINRNCNRSHRLIGLITYLPFLLLQAAVYAGLTWFALKLEGSFVYFLIVLYVSLLSTNSFVVFVSSVVPNFILGYAAVIAFTALFFLFCGYFLSNDDIPKYWRWMNKISTMTYPYEGLLINEYQRDDVFGQTLAGTNVTGIDILRSLQIYHENDKKWLMVYIMLGWAVIYRILFYVVLRFASKNQRT